MKPAYKFLKHKPRGLKLKGGALVEEREAPREAPRETREERGKVMPLRFKK